MTGFSAGAAELAEIVRNLEREDYAEAERLCDQHLLTAPQDSAVRGLLAVAYAQQGRLILARELLAGLLTTAPQNLEFQINLGSVCLDMADLPAAIAALENARAIDPGNVTVLLNLGIAHYRGRDYRTAVALLESALFAVPAMSVAAIYLARCFTELDETDNALLAIQLVRTPQGLDATALNELGLAWLALDENDRAQAAFELALQLDPAFDETLTNLAALAERANRIADAQAYLARHSARGLRHPVACLTQARVLGRLGEVSAALDLLASIPVDGLDFRGASEVAFERGQLFDRTGDTDAAFHAFSLANQLARDHRARGRPATTSAPLDWMRDHPGLDAVVLAAQFSPPAQRTPIFLVGFPRSGTTLLDQALDAHPAFSVLEEKPAVEAMARLLRQRSIGYPMSLAELTPVDIDRLRAAYWGVVERHLRIPSGKTLIDKYPLNLAHLQLIMRVFPGARFIFSVRHPCDVVLSCFMQNFRFTDSTQGFWNLESSAQIYTRVMNLWLNQRSRMRPPCLDLRYEHLVADFEGQLRGVLKFLDVPWDAAVLKYAEHARGRNIRTPSYKQVVEPVYLHARGRWLRYRRHLQDIEPILAPCVARLGYPDIPSL